MTPTRHALQIPLEPVTSSNLRAIGYDPATETLEVEFTAKSPGGVGARWRYAAVPPAVFEQFRTAESVGSFFAREVRPRFTAARVEQPVVPPPA